MDSLSLFELYNDLLLITDSSSSLLIDLSQRWKLYFFLQRNNSKLLDLWKVNQNINAECDCIEFVWLIYHYYGALVETLNSKLKQKLVKIKIEVSRECVKTWNGTNKSTAMWTLNKMRIFLQSALTGMCNAIFRAWLTLNCSNDTCLFF